MISELFGVFAIGILDENCGILNHVGRNDLNTGNQINTSTFP